MYAEVPKSRRKARLNAFVTKIINIATFCEIDQSPHEQYIQNIMVVTMIVHLLIPITLMLYALYGLVTGLFADDLPYRIFSLIIIPGVAFILNAILLPRTLKGDVKNPGKIIIGVSLSLLMVSIYFTGGLYALAIFGLITLFVMGIIIVDFRAMMVFYWLIITFFIFLFIIESFEYLPTFPAFALPFQVIVLIATLTTLLFVVSYHKYALLKSGERMAILQSQQERYQVQQELTQNIAHDLRTPVSVIKTTTYLIKKRQEQGMPIDEKLKILDQVSDNMTQMIDDLLDLMILDRLSSLDISQKINIADLVHQATSSLHDYAVERDITLECSDNTSGEALIYGNTMQLKRAITNLIDNAIHYTNTGGEVVASINMDKDIVIIQIKDNGIGIAPENHKYIFERFYRVDEARTSRDRMGTGIGLSIVERIVRLHSGQIQVDSELGQGTTFTVTIPL